MTTSFNINKLLHGFVGKTNPINIVARRFLRVFNDHGVETSQISRLFPQIKLADLESEKALLNALTPELLDQTAQLFGVRSQWLEGVDDTIYDCHFCYKHPTLFFKHFVSLKRNTGDAARFPVRALTTAKNLDYKNPDSQQLALVLVEQIAILEDKPVCRYHIYGDSWDWAYTPTRIQLKAMVRYIHDPVPLFFVSTREIHHILEGKQIPRCFIEGCLLTEPSLEDYTYTQEESVVAKEVEELPEVLRYIEELKSENLTPEGYSRSSIHTMADSTQEDTSGYESESPQTDYSKKSGKRDKNNQALWDPTRTVASLWWSNDGSLSIAEIVRRIKKTPTLKASSLTESAIRKHIADLAPPGIRGKPGRKPNKLS